MRTFFITMLFSSSIIHAQNHNLYGIYSEHFTIISSFNYLPTPDYLAQNKIKRIDWPTKEDLIKSRITRIERKVKTLSVIRKDSTYRDDDPVVFYYNKSGLIDSIIKFCFGNENISLYSVQYKYGLKGIAYEEHFSWRQNKLCISKYYNPYVPDTDSYHQYSYEYDSLGNIVSSSTTEQKFENGEIIAESTECHFYFFEQGKLVKDSISGTSDTGFDYSNIEQYFYNKKGLLIKIIFDQDESLSHLFYYNEKDQLIQKKAFLKDEKKKKQFVVLHDWNYDSLGNLVQETIYRRKHFETRSYYYDLENRLVQIDDYNPGHWNDQYKIHYNQMGLPDTFLTYRSSSNYTHIETFNYISE